MNRKDRIAADAARLRSLHEAVHETFHRRDRSCADFEGWKAACAAFHEQYDTLFYPGGGEQIEAVRRCDPVAVEVALDFLEMDPRYFRSGYHKEFLWTYLRRCPLTADQIARLEAVALAYTRRRITREFWYMCRAMSRIATAFFWEGVDAVARDREGLPEGIRASYLAAYEEGIPAGEEVRRQVYEDVLHRRWGHFWEKTEEAEEAR